MTLVMDSSALIALLRKEEGEPVVRAMLRDEICVAHAINLCEVYYDTLRLAGDLAAAELLSDLASRGLIIRDDIDTAFWQEAGRYKADLRRVSLADCFCLTLANRLQAQVVTADHHEFDAVDRKGLCGVRFIR